MVNEFKDCYADRTAEAECWVSKFPFLRIKDNSICPWLNDKEVEAHWLQELPKGWVIKFGEQMCYELLNTLGDYVDDWIIIQVKEKFGEMRIYHYFKDGSKVSKDICNKVDSIIDKYSEISECTCVSCGKRATYYSTGWILPYCEECHNTRCEHG